MYLSGIDDAAQSLQPVLTCTMYPHAPAWMNNTCSGMSFLPLKSRKETRRRDLKGVYWRAMFKGVEQLSALKGVTRLSPFHLGRFTMRLLCLLKVCLRWTDPRGRGIMPAERIDPRVHTTYHL